MPISKNRKQHKEKAKARSKKILEQRNLLKKRFVNWAKRKEDELSQPEHTAVQV